jgi:disulfide bond formation protein DsbB
MTTKADIALSAPPVAIAGASFLGYSLPEWAAIVTILYTLLLIARMVVSEWRLWRESREDTVRGSPE